MVGRWVPLPPRSAVYRPEGCLCCLRVGTGLPWPPFYLLSSEPLFQGCGQTNISCKVVKGQLVEVGKWPWQVSILFLGVYICSGSLVHHQWVLTAAHCLKRSVRVASRSQGFCFLAGRALVKLGFWEEEPGWVALCSACVSLTTYGLTAGNLPPTPGLADPRSPRIMS